MVGKSKVFVSIRYKQRFWRKGGHWCLLINQDWSKIILGRRHKMKGIRKCKTQSNNEKQFGQGKIICARGVFGIWYCRERATHSCLSMHHRWPDKRKKKQHHHLFRHSWLHQHNPALAESEAAAVCEVIQDFIQLPASQHPWMQMQLSHQQEKISTYQLELTPI